MLVGTTLFAPNPALEIKEKSYGQGHKRKVEAANAEAIRRIIEADPVLVDIAPASEVIRGLKEMMVLHGGPPVTWQNMCGAQRGTAIGMVLFEGWAESTDDAIQLLDSGAITFEPNHHH